MLCASRRASPSAPAWSQSPAATARRKPSAVPSPPATVWALAEKRPLWSSEPPVSALRQGVSP